MSLNYDNIRGLLVTQIQTVQGLPQLQNENTRITPGALNWCRASLLPAEPNALTVGPNGQNEHQGLLQLDLFYPQDSGTSTPNAMASAVMAALPRGYIAVNGSTNVHVRMVHQQTAYQLERWYVVPVVVRWASYA